jgi:hypothetical protein
MVAAKEYNVGDVPLVKIWWGCFIRALALPTTSLASDTVICHIGTENLEARHRTPLNVHGYIYK